MTEEVIDAIESLIYFKKYPEFQGAKNVQNLYRGQFLADGFFAGYDNDKGESLDEVLINNIDKVINPEEFGIYSYENEMFDREFIKSGISSWSISKDSAMEFALNNRAGMSDKWDWSETYMSIVFIIEDPEAGEYLNINKLYKFD